MGSEKETQAIQHVIDRCAEHGSGTIYFPAGTYLTKQSAPAQLYYPIP